MYAPSIKTSVLYNGLPNYFRLHSVVSSHTVKVDVAVIRISVLTVNLNNLNISLSSNLHKTLINAAMINHLVV